MKPEMIKKTILRVIPAVLLVALSAFLLKGDVWTFWTWYLLAAVLGIVGMGITGRLFRGFADKGWMFSKVAAITIAGFLTWFLVSIRILKFTTVSCAGVTVVFAIVSILLYEKQRKDTIILLYCKHFRKKYSVILEIPCTTHQVVLNL